MNSRFLAALISSCLLCLCLAGSALAHAELVESDPAEGEAVVTPARLTAVFSIELDPDPQRSFVIVRDQSGAEVARGSVSAEDLTTISVELPALPAGQYAARWQAHDPTDDHTERGTINFIVADPPTPSPAPARTATPAPATLAPGTAEPTARPSPAASPGPSPSPDPGDGAPTAGLTDLLLALLLAGALIGGLALYLLRRR